ncbi:hypothetical protein NDU88_004488 [Pleurodeles waltl]|uniref:Uncharacterized protein n=1 Tax=Pleurodeles waltl TaxID=8319 RepID=A0AAV7PD50_PLEWA|nr:hypothetical protein NDU88_004488 [Pleurodeles waltl]
MGAEADKEARNKEICGEEAECNTSDSHSFFWVKSRQRRCVEVAGNLEESGAGQKGLRRCGGTEGEILEDCGCEGLFKGRDSDRYCWALSGKIDTIDTN